MLKIETTMPNSNDDHHFIIFMYCAIRRTQFGEFRSKQYRDAKFAYKKQLNATGWVHRCPECKRRMNSRRQMNELRMTIDHVIPLWVCREYNMPQLEFDQRNFRVLCQGCNVKRAQLEMTIEDVTLSQTVKDRIIAKSEEWTVRMGKLTGVA